MALRCGHRDFWIRALVSRHDYLSIATITKCDRSATLPKSAPYSAGLLAKRSISNRDCSPTDVFMVVITPYSPLLSLTVHQRLNFNHHQSQTRWLPVTVGCRLYHPLFTTAMPWSFIRESSLSFVDAFRPDYQGMVVYPFLSLQDVDSVRRPT